MLHTNKKYVKKQNYLKQHSVINEQKRLLKLHFYWNSFKKIYHL